MNSELPTYEKGVLIIKDNVISVGVSNLNNIVNLVDIERITSYKNFIDTSLYFPPIILPENCKYHAKTKSSDIYIIEVPPSKKSMKMGLSLYNHEKIILANSGCEFYNNSNTTKEFLNTLLYLPYVIFVVEIYNGLYDNDDEYNHNFSLSVFFRLNPLKSINDTLIITPFPNVYNDGKVCLGDSVGENLNYEEEGSVLVNKIVSLFWESSFNLEVSSNYSKYESEIESVQNFLKWSYISKENPLSIFKYKWIYYNKTLRNILEDFGVFDYENIINEYSLRDNDYSNYIESLNEVYIENNNKSLVISKDSIIRLGKSNYNILSIDSQYLNLICENDKTLCKVDYKNDRPLVSKIIQQNSTKSNQISKISIGKDISIKKGDTILVKVYNTEFESAFVYQYKKIKKILKNFMGLTEILFSDYTSLVVSDNIVNSIELDNSNDKDNILELLFLANDFVYCNKRSDKKVNYLNLIPNYDEAEDYEVTTGKKMVFLYSDLINNGYKECKIVRSKYSANVIIKSLGTKILYNDSIDEKIIIYEDSKKYNNYALSDILCEDGSLQIELSTKTKIDTNFKIGDKIIGINIEFTGQYNVVIGTIKNFSIRYKDKTVSICATIVDNNNIEYSVFIVRDNLIYPFYKVSDDCNPSEIGCYSKDWGSNLYIIQFIKMKDGSTAPLTNANSVLIIKDKPKLIKCKKQYYSLSTNTIRILEI